MNLREITFYNEGSYRKVRVSMPTSDEVVFSECEGLGETWREVSRGKFETAGLAAQYYHAKTDSLHAMGWITLSFAGEENCHVR